MSPAKTPWGWGKSLKAEPTIRVVQGGTTDHSCQRAHSQGSNQLCKINTCRVNRLSQPCAARGDPRAAATPLALQGGEGQGCLPSFTLGTGGLWWGTRCHLRWRKEHPPWWWEGCLHTRGIRKAEKQGTHWGQKTPKNKPPQNFWGDPDKTSGVTFSARFGGIFLESQEKRDHRNYCSILLVVQ